MNEVRAAFRFKRLGFLLCMLFMMNSTAYSAVEERHEDHEALRAVLRTATEALNTRNVDALAPILYKDFSITTVEQKLFTDLPSFKTYFDGLFEGPNGPIKTIVFNPKADVLTVFIDEKTGISHGTSEDTYTFTKGGTRVMKSRWSAAVYKDDGGWKVLNLHMSANILDNPLVTAAQKLLYQVGAGALIIGLLLGFVLKGVLQSKKGA
jgi:hypothetical protein